MQRMIIFSILIVSVVLFAEPPQYKLTPLGNVEVEKINDHGQVVGGYLTDDSYQIPFFWQDGVMTSISGGNAWAIDINNSGQVLVGIGGGYSYIWQNGKSNSIGKVEGHAINDYGQVVGITRESFGVSAFLWENGVLTDLEIFFGGIQSAALDINNKGQIVGYAEDSPYSFRNRAFLWQNGTASDLKIEGQANAINNHGLIIGSSDKGQFIWKNGNTEFFPSTWFNDLNDLGQIVGSTFSQQGYRAILMQDDIIYDLNNFIYGDNYGLTLQSAISINNNGQIVGLCLTPSGKTESFLFTPIPEPATIGLLGLGGIAVFRKRQTSARRAG